jgi:NADH-quinone oxidoreductase subunit A
MEILSENAIWSPWEPGLLALVAYGAMVFILVGVILFLSGWVGEKHPSPEKARPYESGITPTGSARYLLSVPFYLVATFFLIFDVEAIYIFSWAIAAEPLGWEGWLQMSFFIFILLISLFYLWEKGGLDWGRSLPKIPGRPRT